MAGRTGPLAIATLLILAAPGRAGGQDPEPSPAPQPAPPAARPECTAGQPGQYCLILRTPPTAYVVGGETLPRESRAAPWQAQIYSTYDYTEADVAADSALADTDPAKAHLAVKADWERRHRCGGVYIGDGWVLTAAHCVTKGPADFLNARRVRLGVNDLSKPDAGYAIAAAVVHRGYEEALNANDIALLKIAVDPPPDPARVRAIALLGEKQGAAPLEAGDSVTVTGWGATGATAGGPLLRSLDGQIQRASALLKQVTLAVMPAADCNRVPAYRGAMTNKVICAGSRIAGQDACTWDSGGPLVRSADTLLVGLVSWGKGCGLLGVPGIYTRVSAYKNWIKRARGAPMGRVTRM